MNIQRICWADVPATVREAIVAESPRSEGFPVVVRTSREGRYAGWKTYIPRDDFPVVVVK